MPEQTRKAVEQEAARLFGTGSVKGVLLLLDQYQCPPDEPHRVHLAVLKLSEGKIELLKHFIKQAQDDFRDVLYWAEYYGRKGA